MNAARVSLIANGLFVGLLFVLHGLKSDLDPSWHFISEYAIGRHGWLMQFAFLALAVANLTMLSAIRASLRGVWGKVGMGLYLVGTFGVVVSAVCVTDPINTPPELRTTSGNLHNLGGALGLFGFLGTLIFSVSLLRSPAWRPWRSAVWAASVIVVTGFFVSFISITVMAARYEGVFSPDTPVGWPNRLGILSGCVWLAIISSLTDRAARPSSSD